MHHSNPLSRKNQVLDPFCQEKSQFFCLACQEVIKSWLYSAQSDPRLGPSLGRETQDLGFLWAETPKSWFFSVNRNLRDRLWSVLLAALYLTWSDSESGLGPCLIFFWIRRDAQYGLAQQEKSLNFFQAFLTCRLCRRDVGYVPITITRNINVLIKLDTALENKPISKICLD